MHDGVRFLPPVLHFPARDLNEATLQIQPEISLIVKNKCIDSIAGKAVPNCEGLLSSFSPRDHSKVCSSQYSPIGSDKQLIHFRIVAGNRAVPKRKHLEVGFLVSGQIAAHETQPDATL